MAKYNGLTRLQKFILEHEPDIPSINQTLPGLLNIPRSTWNSYKNGNRDTPLTLRFCLKLLELRWENVSKEEKAEVFAKFFCESF